MAQSIKQIILKEHEFINKLLEKIKKENADYEKTKINFSKFKWNLDKHFFIEERAILSMLKSTFGTQTADSFKILQDHSKISCIIKKNLLNLNKKIKPDVDIIFDAIRRHEKFEEEYFYPRLEEELDTNSKKEIISRIKEVILG